MDGEQSDEAFRSDSSDLDNATILHGLDARNQASIDEVEVVDRRAGAKKDLVLSQAHRFQMRPNGFEARELKRLQQPVARTGFPNFVDHASRVFPPLRLKVPSPEARNAIAEIPFRDIAAYHPCVRAVAMHVSGNLKFAGQVRPYASTVNARDGEL
jgi:hypothetical protein